MRRLTGEWLRKAEADLAAARRLLAGRPPLYDSVCFHFQQAGERPLKALLQELALPVPRSHDLEFLLGRLIPVRPVLRALQRVARGLKQCAVEYRYPGSHDSGRQARSAAAGAGRIQAAIRRELGLRARLSGTP